MGRHTASRASLPALVVSAARRSHVAARAVRRPRTLATGAAVAAVTLTATTAAAAFAEGSAAPSAAPGDTSAAAPAATTTTAPALGVAAADPATVDAASDALVRAQFLTGEGAASLTPEQVAQIEDAQARLSQAVTDASSASPASGLAGLAAGTELRASDVAEETADVPAEAEQDALTAADTLAASVPVLDERGTDRASRSSGRVPLADLGTVAPTLGAVAPDLAAPADAPDAEPSDEEAAAAAIESPEEDAAAADAATEAPDLTTAPEAEGADSPASADAAAPAGTAPTTDEIAALTAELSTLLDAAGSGVAVEVVPGPPSPAEIAAQLDRWAASTAGFGNGQIPADALCELSFAAGEQLRCDAAHQIEALNAKYKETFGANLSVTDSYRSYASQVAVKASRGYFAAPPGMSNHGWALALDLGGGIQGYGTAQYEWMRANAPAYGWDNPEWARAGGNKNEPWHWEYGDIS